jgi:hypothetical protein
MMPRSLQENTTFGRSAACVSMPAAMMARNKNTFIIPSFLSVLAAARLAGL